MLYTLWLVPTFPLIGFFVLAIGGSNLSRKAVACITLLAMGLSALFSFLVSGAFLASKPITFTQTLWTWMNVGGFDPAIGLHLDALSMVMMLIVTFVGFLIHLYSIEYMHEDSGYARFFAYMNLFIASMLLLLLADNLVFLYLGWEGVGLCSYLLIGFWYHTPANGYAAQKAFIVTRIGDAAMAIGLFLLFANFGTLHIQALLQLAPQQWESDSVLACTAAALLMIGAFGKSAQLPLQTWLPDAMAGPTPVSALIHAATMVTAGVYLIARTHTLFELAPSIQLVIAIIGAATLLIAGCSALVQRDIKRVLAYSTISQIGYMFLALGVGAWSEAIFHFMTHAFFKALLFLGAGAVIMAMHHEHDMFKMGGLYKKLPVTFWTFLIGAASLAALPLVTAGFYSKDLILWKAWNYHQGGGWLWLAGLLGAFITMIYTARMVIVTFFGKTKKDIHHSPGYTIKIPLVILAVFSIIAGFVEMPHTLGGFAPFGAFMHTILPHTEGHGSIRIELVMQIIASFVALSGLLIAYVLYYKNPHILISWLQHGTVQRVQTFWLQGWGFDAFYRAIFIQPFISLAHINKRDVFNAIPLWITWVNRGLYWILRQTQTGNVRWYASGIAVGAIILIAIMVII